MVSETSHNSSKVTHKSLTLHVCKEVVLLSRLCVINHTNGVDRHMQQVATTLGGVCEWTSYLLVKPTCQSQPNRQPGNTVEQQIIHYIKYSCFSWGTNSRKLHVVKMDGGDSPHSSSVKIKSKASVDVEKICFSIFI